jgi:hypothetical protein
MRRRGWMVLGLVLSLAIPILAGCAATTKNLGQISMGMTQDQVREIAGKPCRILAVETSGQHTLLAANAGKYEIWLYCCGAIEFSEGKVVAKGEKRKP